VPASNEQPPGSVIRARIVVRGRVQGVAFRAAARMEARARGLTGWVRNRADGSVEALAQGPRAQVEGFVDWCRHGPPGARVASLDRREEPPESEPADFDIRT